MSKTRTEKACAAQHFGAWMIEPKWFLQAVRAVKAGDWKADGGMGAEAEMEDGPGYTVTDGVARIEIAGQITKRGSSYGGASSVEIRQAIRAAVDDRAVRSILLHIDSPGGTVAGTADLADEVRKADAVKPVFAHIDDLGASAAYWVACAARRITANITAEVGSIGVVAVVQDSSGAAELAGVKVNVVSTGPFKGSFVDGAPITPEQLAQLKIEVEDLNKPFLDAVMRGRGMSPDQLAEIADGRVFVAAKAKDLGLIDAVQSIEATCTEIYNMNLDQFRAFAAEHPEAITPFVEQGRKSGVADGRTEAKAEAKSLLAAAGGDHKLALESFIAGKPTDVVAAVVADREAQAAATAKAIAERDAKIAALEAKVGTQGAVGHAEAAPVAQAEAAKPNPATDPKAAAKAEWDAMSAGARDAWAGEKVYIAARVRELARA